MKVGDLVLIYKDITPMCLDGGVAQIIDTSGDDPNTILVANLEDIGEVTYKNRHDPDVVKWVLLAENSFWVNKVDCKRLSLDKPSFLDKVKDFFSGILK